MGYAGVGGSCRGGVGYVGWVGYVGARVGGSCRGGVDHARVDWSLGWGGSCSGGVGYVGVGCVCVYELGKVS